jgi:hypothetical protein
MGTLHNKRLALKGREIPGYQMNLAHNAATEVRVPNSDVLQLYHWTLLPPCYVRTFDLAPLQGASLWVVSSQG